MEKPSPFSKLFTKSDEKKYTVRSENGFYEQLDNLDNINASIKSNHANLNGVSEGITSRFKLAKVKEKSDPVDNTVITKTDEDNLEIDENSPDIDNPCYFTVSAYDDKNIHCSRHITSESFMNPKKKDAISEVKKDRKTSDKHALGKTQSSRSDSKTVNDKLPLTKLESITKNKDFLMPKKSVTNSILSSSGDALEKQFQPSQIKRRTITEVIGNIDKPSNDPGNNSNVGLEKIIPLPSAKEEEKHCEEEHSVPHLSGTGFSIIYGMFIFIFGTFLCLDVYSGKLGNQRIVNALFFIFLYGVSIFSIIFLYVDIKRYAIELNKIIKNYLSLQKAQKQQKYITNQQQTILNILCLKIYEKDDQIDGHYFDLKDFQSILRNGTLTNAQQTIAKRNKMLHKRISILSTIDETNVQNNDHYYNAESSVHGDENDKKSTNSKKSVGDEVSDSYSEITDLHKKTKFTGYLTDKSAAYNLYLRAGIGTFCVITLLQCLVDIIEAIEMKFECEIENYEAVVAILQFLFASLQFLFIFSRGNIVICRYESFSSVFIMHIAVTNLIVWVKNILLETMNEYYDEQLVEEFEKINLKNSTTKLPNFLGVGINKQTDPISTSTTDLTTTITTITDAIVSTTTTVISTLTQNTTSHIPYSTIPAEKNYWNYYNSCYTQTSYDLQKFAITIKPYLYPASIEFSVICATVFAIMWTRIGSSENKHRQLLTTTNFDEDKPYTPNPSMLIMLDCTKTSRGLFFGLLVFVCTILSTIIFHVYSGNEDKQDVARLISQLTEASLLLIALIITVIAYFKIIKFYTKVIPQVNAFDVVLEVLSMFGIYVFSINSLIAISSEKYDDYLDYKHSEVYFTNENKNIIARNSNHGESADPRIIYANASVAVLSIIQGTIQTFFILECLRRYAYNKRELVNKPARELITALLLTNISLWFYDTLSAKRFDTNAITVEHFGILKWSIINAFGSPLAIFYRFHSSVCLSDIWYGLYYGEIEKPDDADSNESHSKINVV